MVQPRYIIHWLGEKQPRQADITGVTYRDVMKDGKAVSIKGIGTFRHRVPTGRVTKQLLDVHTTNMSVGMPATHEGVKGRIRMLRPDEAAELDAIDTTMQALRERRREVMRKAWMRGHSVQVKDLVELAEQALERKANR